MEFNLDAKNYELLPNDVIYTGKATLHDVSLVNEEKSMYIALKLVIKDKYYTILKWTSNYLDVQEFATICANNLMRAIRDNCSTDFTKNIIEKCKTIDTPRKACLELLQVISDNELKLEMPIKIYFQHKYRRIDLYPC